MSDTTLITVRVSEKTKDNLKNHLGEATFKDMIQFVESLFNEGDVYSENGVLYLNQQGEVSEDPLITEFKAVCESVSMDWTVGIRKAISAIRRRDI